MKKILLLILITSSSYGQWDHWDWFGRKTSGSNFVSQVVSTAIDTSLIPVVPYTNMALDFTVPQYGKFLHKTELESRFTYLDVRWKEYFRGGTALSYIMGQYALTTYALLIARNNRITTLRLRNTTWIVDTLSYTGWASYRLLFDNGTLTCYRNDTVKATYTEIAAIDTVNTVPLLALAVGDDYQPETEGLGDVYNNGGTYNGILDDLFMRVDSDTLFEINFDNGVVMLDKQQWGLVGTQTIHDYRTRNMLGGYAYMTYSYYHPVFVNNEGTRKDTLKYFTFPNSGVRGLRSHESSPKERYVRSAVNDVDSRGNEFIVCGEFGFWGDSTHEISSNVGKWKNNEWQSIGDTGIGDLYPYHFEWINDTAIVLVTTDYVVKKGVILNTETGGNYIFPVDSFLLPMGVLRDTIFYLDGRRLIGIDPYTLNKTIKYVFTDLYADIIKSNALGVVGDTIIVCAGYNIYYLRNGVLLNTRKIEPAFEDPARYMDGGIWYDGIRSDGEGRIFFMGNFRGIDSVIMDNLGYEKNGQLYGIGVGGQSDGITGSYTTNVTGMVNYRGEHIFTGGFRTAGGENIGSHIFMWNERDGVRPLDYGTTWHCWEVDTFSNNGYTDLVFVGDGIEAGGTMTNCVWGRYSDEHFRILEPIVQFTPITNVNLGLYPPTLSGTIWSPSWRALTVDVDYHVNYDGAVNTFSMSKTDSTLDPYIGTWQFDWSGQFAGSVEVNDTVFYTITATDNLGNSKDTSGSFKIIITELTDSLYANFNYNDLLNGTITEWQSRTDTLMLRTSAGTITKDTNAVLAGSNTTMRATASYTGTRRSIELIASIYDTNKAVYQIITQFERPSYVLGLVVQSTTEASHKMAANFFNGSGWVSKEYKTTEAVRFQKYTHYVVTTDGTNIWYYMNGTLIGNQQASSQTGGGSAFINLFGLTTTGFATQNTGVKVLKYYMSTLSQANVTQNYTYFNVNGYITP